MADSRDVLLVDGYNMIGDWPELSRLAESGLEEARNRLLFRLADYQAFSGRKVIVVLMPISYPDLVKHTHRARCRSILPRKRDG